MRMMNEAIEGARDFRDMIDRIEADAAQTKADRFAEYVKQDMLKAIGSLRQVGENRVMHRARLKRERREAKTRKAAA